MNSGGEKPIRSQGPKPSQQIGNGAGRDNLLSRPNQTSRSGSVGYSGSNNIAGRVRSPITISAMPIIRPPERNNNGSLQNQVQRYENIRVNPNWRSGYCAYNSNWNDNWFSYPFYSFNWSYNSCAVSPWYWYPNLPPYVSYSRCNFNRPVFNIIVSLDYLWNSNSYDRYGNYDRYDSNRDLDYALEDIENIWNDRDFRALSNLLPQRGEIYVTMENGYQYSLNSDDFYDMMVDNISSTRTIRYRVLNVRTGRDGAKVIASHEFEDPWGRRTTVYHRYSLQRERRNYELVEFSTSPYRPSW